MNISEECFKEIVEMVEALIEEADHHANEKNPVVKITDKNMRVASGKRLLGPFNKNHVGQYIVYNKDIDASYLVTPDNWKKSKIKKDLESQGKFYEALEKANRLIEGLFVNDGRGDLLDDLTGKKMTGVERIKSLVKGALPTKKVKKNKNIKLKKCKANESLEEALAIMEEIINELDYNFADKQIGSAKKTLKKKEEEAEKLEGDEKEQALKDALKYQHKLNVTNGHIDSKKMAEIKAEEEAKNKGKNK